MMILFFLSLFSFSANAESGKLVCPSGQYLVKAHSRKSYFRADGTYVRPSAVKSHCKNFSPGYLFAMGLFKDSLPKEWPHAEKSAVWSEGEREAIIAALDGLPPDLFSKNLKAI